MNRLKFLLFALLALGLWGYSLVLVSPAIASRGAEQAARSAWGAPAAVALRIESQRSLLQAGVVRLAASPLVHNLPARAPALDRFEATRAAALEGFPEDRRELVLVGLANEQGALVSQGKTDPTSSPDGLNALGVAKASGSGTVQTVFGVPYLVYSLPSLAGAGAEAKATAYLLVGLPVLPDPRALADGVAKEFQLSGLALIAGDKVVASAGPKKELAEAARKSLKAGQSATVAEGAVDALGPVPLPVLVAGPPQEIAVRRELANTPWEVIAVASTQETLQNLVAYQKFAIMGLGGLLLLAVVVLALLRSGGEEDDRPAMVVPAPAAPASSRGSAEQAAPSPLAHPAHAGPEAHPDDFQFPASSVSAFPPEPAPPQSQSGVTRGWSEPARSEPLSDPFAMASAPPPPLPPGGRQPPVATAQQPAYQLPGHHAAPPSLFDEDASADAEVRTRAYPSMGKGPPPVADPFMATPMAPQGSFAPSFDADSNPDATRVAAVPQELLRAAKHTSGTTGERPALRAPTTSPSMPKISSLAPPSSGGLGDEERHFQDVFKDFVATRERCSEPSDGLTYDKFKAKLVKNKEQLVTKYNCRTVRFQVYVKEGKAALKATPVKD